MRILLFIFTSLFLVIMLCPNVYAQHLKWRFGNTYPIVETPAVNDDGMIFFDRANDMKLYAVNSDGSTAWVNDTIGPNINSCPAIGPKGKIYIGAHDNEICSIDPEGGSVDWRFSCKAKVNSTPTIAQDGTIYVSPYSKELYAINPDGTKKWMFEHSGYRTGSSPSIGKEGTIYLADMSLYAIESNGQLKWKYSPGVHGFEYAPAIGPDGTIYVGSSFDGSIHALSPQKNVKWIHKSENSSGIHSTPAVGPEGTIYASRLMADSPTNALFAINPNGTTLWKTEIRSNIIFSPTVGDDGTIYVGAMYKPKNWEDGASAVYAINPDDGSVKWKYTFDVQMAGRQPSPTLASDGTMYIGALYALQTDSNGLANSSWPMFHHDNKNTGSFSSNFEPKPVIKANGSDDRIRISSSNNLSVSISLSSGGYKDQNADWWIASYSQTGWKSFVVNSESYGWKDGIKRCIKIPLIELPPLQIPQPPLSAGTNVIVFAVDDNANDQPDVTWWDYVEVILE